ncbi:putative DNA methylase [Nitrosomonas sp. Is79A3]|uniref:type IIL restriction-modification enzyme MmeI n=1 Tax=Nitrosomonas sp. (strain Is79A3) TaxID=261292 RepID=UPI000215CB84
MNAVEIEEAISKLAEQPFDPAQFPYAFLEAFGNKATTISRLRSGNSNKTDIAGAVLQYNNIHISACPAGEVLKTLEKLRNRPATNRQKAKFIHEVF